MYNQKFVTIVCKHTSDLIVGKRQWLVTMVTVNTHLPVSHHNITVPRAGSLELAGDKLTMMTKLALHESSTTTIASVN